MPVQGVLLLQGSQADMENTQGLFDREGEMAGEEDGLQSHMSPLNNEDCPSVISVSRRTDIPSFHAKWFVKRVAEGYVNVKNPFSPTQVRRVSLRPADVAAFVFWTRDFTPLRNIFFPVMESQYISMILWTVTGYPKILEPMAPPLQSIIRSFRETADSLGKGHIVWRYDPIILNDLFTAEWHIENFSHLASALEGSAERVIISLMTPYRTVLKRFGDRGVRYDEPGYEAGGEQLSFLSRLSLISRDHGMTVQACCHRGALLPHGIADGACIDAAYMSSRLGLELSAGRDPGQRKGCLCAKSIDIGAYECCPRNCLYCYATRSPEKSRLYYQSFDQSGDSLR